MFNDRSNVHKTKNSEGPGGSKNAKTKQRRLYPKPQMVEKYVFEILKTEQIYIWIASATNLFTVKIFFLIS